MQKKAIFVVCLSLMGCATGLQYQTQLVSTERPTNAKERWGEIEVSEQPDGGHLFEDQFISALWSIGVTNISLALTNKTEKAIKLHWDEAVYVDTRGISHQLFHSGIRYIDRNNPQAPTTVAPKSSIVEVLMPKDGVTYVQDIGWIQSHLIFRKTEEPEEHVGKDISVYLPLEIEGVSNNYGFIFKITGISE